MRFTLIFMLILCGWVSQTFSREASDIPLDAELRDSLASRMNTVLQKHVLEPWYPGAVDETHGGFLTRFNYRWEPQEPQNKMLVTQARLIWTASRASEFFPENEELLSSARHGVEFLRETMWDEQHGGFFSQVSRKGEVMQDDGRIIKQAYDNAFAIYGLAAYADAADNEEALDLAFRAFQWLDQHAYDSRYGGYFNFMQRDGTPFEQGYDGTPPKDQNSSIHLLEAFTELYHLRPDPHLEDRLREMLVLVRDTIRVDPGYLTLFFEADWEPVSYRDSSEAVRQANYYYDHVSFGHDVETAYLMHEAAEALGMEDDSTTQYYGKQMVDHALENGWDDRRGGFYEGGYYFEEDSELTIINDAKNWWSQAEGLNAMLLMAGLYPEEPPEYHQYFRQLWQYIDEYLIDHEYSGWFEWGQDQSPETRHDSKGHIWKTNYHDGRALMNAIHHLSGE